MAISKLKLLEIEFPPAKADEVLSKIIDSEDFAPEAASQFADSVRDITVMDTDNAYADMVDKIEAAAAKADMTLRDDLNSDDAPLAIDEARDIYDSFEAQADEIHEIIGKLQTMVSDNEHTSAVISRMSEDIDFDGLFNNQYLQVRYGRMPVGNLTKLEYYETQEFLYDVIAQDARDAYVFYCATPAKAPEIDNIFSSLYFDRIHVPEYVHGKVPDALKMLEEENKCAGEYIEKLKTRLDTLCRGYRDELSLIRNMYKDMSVIAEARRYVVLFGPESAAIYGYMEDKKTKAFKASMEAMDDVKVDITPPMSDLRLTPPTKLKNNWFSRPFNMFVEMYGVPSYTDMDPTNFVAITYSLLFGIMFGDVGQGILLSIFGYVMYKWKKIRLGAVGMRIGICSAFFGVIFGSVFGSEEILVPFFTPMDSNNTLMLLETAMAIGALLIVVAIMFNTYINAKKKNWAEMWFSQNGVTGLVFYLYVIVMAVGIMSGLYSLPTVLTVAVLIGCIVLMFLKEALAHSMHGEKMFPEGFGAYFTEGFFEMFEVILSFITNTTSFLRVGGFVLSHAGMMLVVYTLAEMVGGFGYWIVLVFGNLFVMCLEGLIVGIQVLRLEFYEMFSRYYEGGGRPFVSMKESLAK